MGLYTGIPDNSISIHALREESDFQSVDWSNCVAKFLSTLSVRRATEKVTSKTWAIGISIHALREESDPAKAI